MAYFEMSKYSSVEDLLKDKVEYLQSVIETIIDEHELNECVELEEATGLYVYCNTFEGDQPVVVGELK